VAQEWGNDTFLWEGVFLLNKVSTQVRAVSDQNKDHQMICTTVSAMWSNLDLQQQLYSWKMDRHV